MRGVRILIITKETDYGLRMLRSLQDGSLHTVGELAQQDLIPHQFAYKILKKLARAGLVQISRGANGGCRLTADLSQTTLYDVMAAMEDRGSITSCMDPDYRCSWRAAHDGCALHCHLARIQQRLNEELRTYSLQDVLCAPPM